LIDKKSRRSVTTGFITTSKLGSGVSSPSHPPFEGSITMTYRSRLVLGISAAALALNFAVAPSAFAEDKMGKDEMKKGAMSHDGMKKDTMAKDGMKKDDAMSKDGMKKDDGMMKKN
jgi:pentapeptide MXKDX repeat protein